MRRECQQLLQAGIRFIFSTPVLCRAARPATPGLEQAANAAADSLHAGAVAGASVGVPSYLHEDDQGASLALDPEAAEQLAAQLKDLASEMASWRLYFHLDSKVAAWLARHEAHQEKKAKADETLLQDGGDLMQEFLIHLVCEESRDGRKTDDNVGRAGKMEAALSIAGFRAARYL